MKVLFFILAFIFLSLSIDHPPSPYINVELQAFHLILTLDTESGGRVERRCNLCHDWILVPIFVHDLRTLVIDGLLVLLTDIKVSI